MHRYSAEKIRQAINLKVDLQLDLLDWAERYFYLPPTAPVPGQWRPNVAPYQALAMRLISLPSYSHVFLVWGAQTGKSTVALAMVLYYIHYDPATILFVLPTQDNCREFSRLRLDSALKVNPALKQTFNWTYNNPENTTFWKTFPGGWISFAWSGSLAQLASKPVRIVIMDEIDRFELTSEGDAFSLAEKRTQAFWNRKLLISSTPTIEGTSRIWYFWNISDQFKFFVPCPNCKTSFTIEWKYVKWEKDNPETAYIECPYCQHKIDEKQRRKILGEGQWEKIKDGKKGYAALHLSGLYSPFVRLTDLVSEFLSAKKYPERLKVFVNTVLAEPWRDEEIEEDELEWIFTLKRDPLPEVGEVYVGVDVQADRLEASFVGFTSDGEIVVLDHKQFFGNIMEEAVWEQTWQDILDASPRAVFVDSSAFTDIVYRKIAEVRKNGAKQVFAIKGLSGSGIPIINSVKYLDKPRIPLISVGVDNLKELVYARIQGRKGICFPKWLSEEYFLQLVAEKPVVRYSKGVPVREWKRIKKRNEALDCLIYAIAAKFLIDQQSKPTTVIVKNPILGVK